MEDTTEGTLVAVGKPYTLPLQVGEGASANFLGDAGHILQVMLPNITPKETKGYRNNTIRVGLLTNGPVVMLLWDFGVGQFDTSFDIKLVPDDILAITEIESDETRMLIQVHVVDTATNLVRALRAFTLPKETTREFIDAACTQQAMDYTPVEFSHRLQELMQETTEQLMARTKMRVCGI